jgi:hypothetical protein
VQQSLIVRITRLGKDYNKSKPDSGGNWRLTSGNADYHSVQNLLLGNANIQQNNDVMQPFSKQQIDKHASTTIEALLETLFSIRFVRSGFKEDS